MRERPNVPRPIAFRALGLACAIAAICVPAPAFADAGDGTRQRPSDVGWTLDLSPGGDVSADALDARGADLPGASDSSRLVAHEVLAGLLAWEAGRGLGDGAHARPVVATVRTESFATADGAGAPALGAALGTSGATIEGVERYRHDALDLSLDGPPVMPVDVVIDELPGLSFERRTLYQATTGRLFVDFRLRHRDPVHGLAALDDEARTAEVLARMRALSTFVLEPADRAFPEAL